MGDPEGRCQLSSSCTSPDGDHPQCDLYVKNTEAYTKYEYQGCSGQNELGVLSDETLESCQAQCSETSDCVSFEFHHDPEGRCQLSSSCTSPDGDYPQCDLYVKNTEAYTKYEYQGCSGQNELGVLS